jgi:arylsulfatase A-like enzyme
LTHTLPPQDDQDLVIGGWDALAAGWDNPMSSTKRVFQDMGATATAWHIHTPICAPSRSELFAGRYYHNIKNAAKSPPSNLCGSGAVGHVDLQAKVYPNIFARNLREEKGYATGLFGKCMNGGCLNPASMHGAFDRWFEGTHFYGGNWYDDGTYWNSTTYGGGYGTRYIRTHESIAIDEVHRRGSSHTTPCGVVLWYSIIMY